jgi:hypothetical protein
MRCEDHAPSVWPQRINKETQMLTVVFTLMGVSLVVGASVMLLLKYCWNGCDQTLARALNDHAIGRRDDGREYRRF